MVVLLFVIGILCGALGGILLKIGADRIDHAQLNSIANIAHFFWKMAGDLSILGGFSLYFLSAVIWFYLLTKLDISYVQPILALTYVVTPILAIFILNEQVPGMRWLGILVIIVGVALVARTS